MRTRTGILLLGHGVMVSFSYVHATNRAYVHVFFFVGGFHYFLCNIDTGNAWKRIKYQKRIPFSLSVLMLFFVQSILETHGWIFSMFVQVPKGQPRRSFGDGLLDGIWPSGISQ
jgi:hypothetical protein